MATHTERALELFRGAYADGELSRESSKALQDVPNVASEVGPSLGQEATNGEILLVSVLVDDSSSIREHTPAVIRGHNRMIEAAARGSGDAKVLFHTRYFTKGLLAPYKPLADAIRLSPSNYAAIAAHTPLYQQSVVMLGSVMMKTRQLVQGGAEVRTFTLILTDGANNHAQSTASDVKFLVTDMLDFATNHKVAGMGIGDPAFFHPIFRDMGIPKEWILAAASTDDDIDRVFRRIERSLKLAASGEEGFLELESGPPAEGDDEAD